MIHVKPELYVSFKVKWLDILVSLISLLTGDNQ